MSIFTLAYSFIIKKGNCTKMSVYWKPTFPHETRSLARLRRTHLLEVIYVPSCSPFTLELNILLFSEVNRERFISVPFRLHYRSWGRSTEINATSYLNKCVRASTPRASLHCASLHFRLHAEVTKNPLITRQREEYLLTILGFFPSSFYM